MADELSLWLVLVGLGAFHGINPAMGWLFAVALGLHRGSRRVVWLALLPIAAGHALSITLVVAAITAFGLVVEQRTLAIAAGALLIGWAAYHALYGRRHRVRVGLRTGMIGLGTWSFLMATSHGAGLMLVPLIIPLAHVGAHSQHAPSEATWPLALAAVGLHSASMLAVTGLIAAIVYEWLGLGFLRRAWINMDLIWILALVATGVVLLLTALL